MAVSFDNIHHPSNFLIGFLVGGGCLFLINSAFQSSTAFLSFFVGIIISGVAGAVFFVYLLVKTFDKIAFDVLQTKDLPRILLNLCKPTTGFGTFAPQSQPVPPNVFSDQAGGCFNFQVADSIPKKVNFPVETKFRHMKNKFHPRRPRHQARDSFSRLPDSPEDRPGMGKRA